MLHRHCSMIEASGCATARLVVVMERRALSLLRYVYREVSCIRVSFLVAQTARGQGVIVAVVYTVRQIADHPGTWVQAGPFLGEGWGND